MPLSLLDRPALVRVRDADGVVRPGLLLARRDDRAYVQVSRGAGDNRLCWLPAGAVEPADDAAPLVAQVRAAPVSLRGPRSWR